MRHSKVLTLTQLQLRRLSPAAAAERSAPPALVLTVPNAFHALDDLQALKLISFVLFRAEDRVEDVVLRRRERDLLEDPLPARPSPVVGRYVAFKRVVQVLEMLPALLRQECGLHVKVNGCNAAYLYLSPPGLIDLDLALL